MIPITVVDTNVMVAALIDTDDDHRRCAEIVESLPRPLILPAMTIAEICHFLDRELGAQAELAFLKMIQAGDILPYYRGSDWDLIVEVAERYVESSLGCVDASVIVTAEQNGTNRIASLDNLMRSIVTDKTRWFEIIPD